LKRTEAASGGGVSTETQIRAAKFGNRAKRRLRPALWAMTMAVTLCATGATRAQDAPESSNPPAPPPSDVQVTVPAPLPQGKKLILKDGTFQIAREYTVEGDRVRYWSVERSDWEEIPASLVDWDATNKAEADQKRADQEAAAQNRARILAEETAGVSQVDASLEVHPGLILPDGIGMFVLGDRQFVALKHLRGDSRLVETESSSVVEDATDAGDTVSTLEWDLAPGVYRYTIDKDLAAGEYAFVETTDDGVDLNVWDFSVDANAAAKDSHAENASDAQSKP